MNLPILYAMISPDMIVPDSLLAAASVIDFAKQLDSDLSVAIGATQISVANVWNSSTIKEIVESEHQRSLESAALTKKKIEQHAEVAHKPIHLEILTGNFGYLKSLFVARARIHGLVYLEKGEPFELLSTSIIEPLLFESGRPVMVVPKGFSATISLDRIVIAWDGSASAARAVWDSVGLFRLAKKIEIVTVVGEKELPEKATAKELLEKLSYLKKQIDVVHLSYDGVSVAEMIQQHAFEKAAGLIVQGAYGRSRWSEFILGGVTRESLLSSSVPILMSH